MSFENFSKPSVNLSSCSTAQHFVDEIGFQIFFYLLYAIVFCVGILGNSLVVYIILKNQAMQNPTNLFIANLAFSDILMCLFSVPFTPIQSFTGQWLFGEVIIHKRLMKFFDIGNQFFLDSLRIISCVPRDICLHLNSDHDLYCCR